MSAAHQVLTQRELFTLLLTYLRGLPFWLRDAIRQYRGTQNRGITRFEVSRWAQEVVLKRGDIVGFRRLLLLQQHNKWYSDPPLIALDGVVSRVVGFGQYALAAWILDHSEREGLVTKQNPIDTDPNRMLHDAVELGRLESIEWVAARFPALLSGPRVPFVVMRSAAHRGATPVLQWLIHHSLHCVDPSFVFYAVESGRTDTLRLLLDSGYEPCAVQHAVYSATGRHSSRDFMEMAQLLLDHGAERPPDPEYFVPFIQQEQDVALIQFLHVKGLLPRINRRAQRYFIRHNRVDHIQYMMEHGLMQPTAMELYYCIEVSNNSTEVLRLLLQSSSHGCLVKARKRAIDCGFRAVEAELTRWIDPSATDCEDRNHGSYAKRRRCQHEPPPTMDE
ncbi:hypothetical protein PINS_up002850 [Pythium insidiosum]|nr:hypothetical protein PINS_up002850 [Pythium insidiosum]